MPVILADRDAAVRRNPDAHVTSGRAMRAGYAARMSEQRTRERHLERLLTFVDAVVAIAITLLVLPLVELTSDFTSDDSVAHLLRTHQPELWSFLLSFVVIARLWFAQHRAMKHVARSQQRVEGVLVLWTLTIVFLPFPTALVADAGEQAATMVLYIGTTALSMAVLAVLERVILTHPEILDGEGAPDPVPAVINALLLAVALAVTLLIPATSYFPMLLLVLDTPVRRVWERVRGVGDQPSGMGE
jgi:uncharacterized membrane protein